MIRPSRVADLISIIVPVYNEEATIAAVLERLLMVPLPAPREIIVVNDGSRDGTRAALDHIDGRHAEISIVNLAENRGKGHALRVGLARATGTVATIQDADLELDPAQIASLVAPILSDEADVVYGSRFLNGAGAASGMALVGNRLLTWATNLLYGSSLTDMETCYKVMRGDIARGLKLEANRFDVEPEITAKLLVAGYRVVERPVSFAPRSRAAGKKIRWRDGIQALRVLMRYRQAAKPAERPAQRDAAV
jgi:glycosyltransferase involved in cell wall biosynthesis